MITETLIKTLNQPSRGSKPRVWKTNTGKYYVEQSSENIRTPKRSDKQLAIQDWRTLNGYPRLQQ